MDPEAAHERAVRALEWSCRLPPARALIRAACAWEDPALRVEVAGLSFPNPVGLAAGFDKDCRIGRRLACLGFGFVELGTVTPRPQEGNPRPRVFRFPEARAVVNRLGFNNEGAERAAGRLRRQGPGPIPAGVNVGINKDVSPEDAPAQYALAFAKLYPYADYFTVNVSSPNTPGLRGLQDKRRLERILLRLKEYNGDRKPVFVKLAPDLDFEALAALLPVVEEHASGVVCTNTTLSRPAELSDEAAHTQGGLSGAPLAPLATRMIREVYRLTGGRLPIIGVGGILGPEDAYQKIRAGASLVQVYTGLVYEGPGLPGRINRGLSELLKSHGLSRVADAVGRSQGEAQAAQ